MSIQTKICGLSTPESITAAIENGASHIGLVFFAKSPRNVDIETAAYLAKFVPDSVQMVGLFVNPNDALLTSVLNEVKIDIIQLHGDETPGRADQIHKTYKRPIMKALPVATSRDLLAVNAFTNSVDYFLFDAKPDPDAALPGGNGHTFDWTILKGYQSPKPYFLAGGLTPYNVAAAIQTLNPYGVDVSSGVESGSGIKDSAKIASFLHAAKSA